MLYNNPEMIRRAKQLRNEMTKEECHLWFDFLKDYPVRFKRQMTVGYFILDFYCASARLAIELDGSQHYSEQGEAYDMERTAILEAQGIKSNKVFKLRYMA